MTAVGRHAAGPGHAGPKPIAFASSGTACSAWRFGATDDRLASARGRPAAVMAHGLAGTKDSGLRPFAEALAAAGIDVLVFDYRGFGESAGRPRQRVRLAAQVADYRAALGTAARLDGVDPRRLVLWGVSLAGGHVLAAAAGRDDVAAVIAVTPLVDGAAAGRLALRHHRPLQLLRSAGAGLRARAASLTGRAPVRFPVVAEPGQPGALSLDGALEAYSSIAGPTWRNEIDASIVFELGGVRRRRAARRLRAPALFQIADHDRSAPPDAAASVAVAARAEVRRYPCDHFDVFPGRAWHETAVAHQVAFLERHLRPTASGP